MAVGSCEAFINGKGLIVVTGDSNLAADDVGALVAMGRVIAGGGTETGGPGV